jgi:glycosyltransferase involved in cell wall biosynthesis
MSRLERERPRVALLSNALGIGGTEKGLASFARELDRSLFDVVVIAVEQNGPRRAEIEGAGIPVHVAGGEEAHLIDLLGGIDIAHVFRAGTPEPLVPRAARAAGVGVLLESNIFGHVDGSPYGQDFACHLFGSRMCLMRYREMLGSATNGDFHRRHKVLSFPIEHESLRHAAPPKAEAQSALGLDPGRPVVGRVGRAADLKWRDLLVDMVPELIELVPEVQILFVGATDAKRARLERLGVRDRCLLVEPALDPRTLATYYAACDVFVSAAEIGESQGMALAEALALEIPVVTCSTPWADNAQVEFVDHGRTGWFASHPRPFAEAVTDLLQDGERRKAFGSAGRSDVERLLSPSTLTRQLERLYLALLAGEDVRDWEPSSQQVEEFVSEYPGRAAAEYRPLTHGERAEVRAIRMRERIRRTRAALGDRGAAVVRDRVQATVRGVRQPPRSRDMANRLARLEAGGRARTIAFRTYLAFHRAAERMGLHAVRASYDSPIPRTRSLPPEIFERESPMRAIDWRFDDQLRFFETELAPYLREFRPRPDPDAPVGSFRLDNQTYDRVDAELLYAVVRHLKPRRFIELGSGYSTLVAWEAMRANSAEGHPAELSVLDPHPSPHVTSQPELAAHVSPVAAQELPEEVVDQLEPSDILFVDTSHTVKIGGDVNRIVLDLLPRVTPGAVVHFHDVFLPRDYSRGHIANAHYWTEQYLLQAFLMYNGEWEVLVSAQALARRAPEVVGRLIQSFGVGVSPGAIWLRRREAAR